MYKTGGKTDPKLFLNCQNVTKLPKNSFLSEKFDPCWYAVACW
jgi:hypothetical protein